MATSGEIASAIAVNPLKGAMPWASCLWPTETLSIYTMRMLNT